jgi:hypothetical protein
MVPSACLSQGGRVCLMNFGIVEPVERHDDSDVEWRQMADCAVGLASVVCGNLSSG